VRAKLSTIGRRRCKFAVPAKLWRHCWDREIRLHGAPVGSPIQRLVFFEGAKGFEERSNTLFSRRQHYRVKPLDADVRGCHGMDEFLLRPDRAGGSPNGLGAGLFSARIPIKSRPHGFGRSPDPPEPNPSAIEECANYSEIRRALCSVRPAIPGRDHTESYSTVAGNPAPRRR